MSPPRIPYGWHQISADDIAAVTAVLRDGALTQGAQVAAFEQALADYCGAPHAVACHCGSAGLLLACRALGLGAGDRLWVPAMTFVASATCGLHCGAEIELLDVEPDTGNLAIPALQARLHAARRLGALPKALVVVHFAGRPCDMAAIGALADAFGVHVIEDAAHALGAAEPSPLGEPSALAENRIGNCRHSDAVVFSFHPVKLITTGEGGMVLTRDPLLAERMRRLRGHDIYRGRDSGADDWRYRIEEAGYNFRLSDPQAALGRSQLGRIGAFLARRRELAWRYHARLQGTPLRLPAMDQVETSAWHLYQIHCPSSAQRQLFFDGLRAAGIGVQVHYQPLYRLGLFADRGWRAEAFPGAERFYAGALSLPLFPGLSDAAQDEVMTQIERLIADAANAAPSRGHKDSLPCSMTKSY